MNRFKRALLLLGCLVVSSSFAADGPKAKLLESFHKIDAKLLVPHETKIKVVTTSDPAHPKVLELTMEYAKAGGWCTLDRMFPEGTINPKKYSAVRFWVRSNSETGINFGFGSNLKRKDGKFSSFNGGGIKATDAWTQVTVPFEKLRRNSATIWKDNAQAVVPGGGEPPDNDDFEGFNRFGFGSHINQRGTSTIGHIMLDQLELIEK